MTQETTVDADGFAALWTSHTPPRLKTSRHLTTGERVFPPVVSHSPLATDFESAPLADSGELYSFTVIHPSPKSGLAPYVLGYIDFTDSAGPVRIFGRVVGTNEPRIGARVRPIPDAQWGYVFEASAPSAN